MNSLHRWFNTGALLLIAVALMYSLECIKESVELKDVKQCEHILLEELR